MMKNNQIPISKWDGLFINIDKRIFLIKLSNFLKSMKKVPLLTKKDTGLPVFAY